MMVAEVRAQHPPQVPLAEDALNFSIRLVKPVPISIRWSKSWLINILERSG